MYILYNYNKECLEYTYAISCMCCQGPVVHQVYYQMDKEATTAPLLEALVLTAVMTCTDWLEAILVGVANQMAVGQGVIQFVHVSSHFAYSWYNTIYLLTK